MKAALTIFMVLAIVLPARSQQLGQYTQYVFNHFSVNPAVAGSKDCLDTRLGFRKQWLNLPGQPTTGWASLHGAILPKGKPQVPYKHGIGAFVESDNAGNWGYTRFVLAYAYHLRMNQDTWLSFGVFAGAEQIKLNVGEVTLVNYDDPAIDGRASVLVAPDVTPGIFMYGKRGWGGVSMHQALGNRLEGIGVEGRLARQFMMSGGYRFPMGRKATFSPSTLMKFSPGAPMAFDLNAMAEWNRVIGLGMGIRGGDAVVFLMKVSFLQYFQLGYSYDVTTSKLRMGSANTHEIVLGITPCGKESMRNKMINCPAFD